MKFAGALLGLLLLAPHLALGQGTPVYQDGPMVPGHFAKFLTNGRIGDAGTGVVEAGAGEPLCASILKYGGVADNSTDNSAAFAATLAASGNRCVAFPAGKYYFASTLAVDVAPLDSVMIMGAGQEVSLLRWPSGKNGIDITLNTRTATFHIRDLSFLAGGPPVQTANGVFIKQMVPEIGSIAMQSDIMNVTFRGSDGFFQTNAWQGGVSILDVTNINFINDDFFGTAAGANFNEPYAYGIFAVGYPGNTTQVAAQFNILSCVFEALHAGIGNSYNVQGFAIANSSFVVNQFGVFVDTPADQKAALQFNNNNCNNLIACVQDNTIGGMPFAIYTGNIVFMGQNGFVFTGNNTIVADNNFWLPLGNNPSFVAIDVLSGSASKPTIIHGNTIAGVPGATIGVGIRLAGFSQGVRINDNMIDPSNVTVPIQNNSTFGNRNFISGQPPNIAAQNVTGAISNVQTGTQSVTAANPSIVSWTAHGLPAGASFKFNAVGGLTGITAGPTYYVSGDSNYLTNSFAYSAAFNGPNVTTGGTTSSVSISTTPELTRLTVPATTGFVTGSYVTVNGLPNAVPCNFVTTVRVVDATHLDLSTCLWAAGTYTSGGTVSTLP